MPTLFRELRHAARTLRRSPAFTATAVLTLALGIAATTAMFSVVDGVLLRPLPVQDEDRLLVVHQEDLQRDLPHVPFTYAAVRDIGEQARLLEDAAAHVYAGPSELVLHRADGAVGVQGTSVTGNYFRTLGVEPVLGRMLRAEDNVSGAEPVAVLGHGLWQRLFGGDPAVVGERLRLNETTYTVVGVAPEGFAYPHGAELWTPLRVQLGATAFGREALERHAFLDVVGRIAPGATREQAEAELSAILERLAAENPNARGEAIVARTLPEVIVGDVRPVLLILAAAVALVLLIAGVNVANLLLIRGIARRREFAVRSAIGAGRGQIARQLLVETLVLALAGGAVGVLVSSWAVDALVALAPPELPRLGRIEVDSRAFGFAATVSILSAVLFGLVPAVGAARRQSTAVLRSGRRTSGGRRTRWPGREMLVVGQVALTLVVLVGAGLLLRSLDRLQSLDLGFRGERLVIADVVVPSSEYPDAEAQLSLFDRVVSRVEALPGVTRATPVYTDPFSGDGGIDGQFRAEGQSPEEAESNPWANMEMAGPSYFETLGQPILRGRGFTEADREGAPRVAVVNEALARLAWPGENPIGKQVQAGGQEGWTVVGVAADARYRALKEVRPSIYHPWRQWHPVGPGRLALRTRSDEAELLPALRTATRQVDPDVDVLSAAPLEQLLAQPLARPRFSTVLLGAFAALGLALSAVGIYGIMAAFVRLRTRELGIRLAIGAKRADVLGVVLRRGLTLAGIGAILGVAAALVGTRALAALLFQVSPTDPLALGAAAGVVLLVAFAASCIPARAATRVDPMRVLQAE